LAWWKEREPQYRALAERRRRAPGTAPAPAPVAVPAVVSDAPGEPADRKPLGIPGPPAVPRTTIQARPRQQRGKKRK
jgi:hypothetical protein